MVKKEYFKKHNNCFEQKPDLFVNKAPLVFNVQYFFNSYVNPSGGRTSE